MSNQFNGNPAAHLLFDFGRPVAYYPGLVKHFGSVNAVLFFCQIFYWKDKSYSELGVYKSSDDITEETGLTYREQQSARKKLKELGILEETEKRLEHRIYFRINLEKLNETLTQVVDFTPNDKSAFRETTKAHSGKRQKRIPGNDKSAFRETTKAHSDHTEITSEITSEITPKGTAASPASPAGGKNYRKSAAGKSKPETSGAMAESTPGDPTWMAYRDAYQRRYGVPPVYNGKTRTQCRTLTERIGPAASEVARFYVEQVSEPFVQRKHHDLGTLLTDCESYHTQWQRWCNGAGTAGGLGMGSFDYNIPDGFRGD